MRFGRLVSVSVLCSVVVKQGQLKLKSSCMSELIEHNNIQKSFSSREEHFFDRVKN